jgi:ketosteroid isomerase-like protein
MKTNRLLSALTLVMTVALLLSACAPAAAPAPTDPLTVVQLYYEALQGRDLDRAMTFVAEDIITTDSTAYYYGKDELVAALQRGWEAGDSLEVSDLKADGNRVTSCYKYYQNGTLLDQSCSGVTHVRDGRIIFDGLAHLESLFVVQEFYEALNAGEVEVAMSWVAPDALFINPTGRYEGQAAIRASLESQAKDGITFELGKFHMVASRVTYEFKVMSGNQLLDSGDNGLTIVKDGLIVFDGTEETLPAQ